jgi:hypothetical protein
MRSHFHISPKIAWYVYVLLVVSIVIVEAFTTTTSSSSSTLRLPTPRVLNTIMTISRASITSRSLNHPDLSTGRNSLVSLASTIGITDAWDAYNHALELHPLIVKSITASIILGLGDFAGQAVQQNMVSSDSSTTTPMAKKGVDYSRAARFAIFGLVLQAPWNHYYYLLLDGQIPPTVDEPFSVTNIMKVGIDQFIQAPIFTVLIFIFLGVLEGKTFDDIKKQLQNDYPETIVANCKSYLPFEFEVTSATKNSMISHV